uniref:disulfide bond formation protein B n=1 Tax=Pararhizobium sp. IMCC3301 TaxID=3067904 RepID=UPI00274186F4|nr:disulfide bond formation protein B [Pararhizobium sp. IMCC3301]
MTMTEITGSDTTAQTRMRLGLLALIVALAAIGGAWAFQLIGGYIPCALCLQQRVPYYAGIPVLLAALLVLRFRPQLNFSRLLFFGFAVIIAYSLYLAVYHAGAEWEFWAGPSDCGGNAMQSDDTSTLLAQLETVRLVSCTEAAGRFLGLSFAGWNAVSTLLLTGLGLLAALLPARAANRSSI